MYRRGKDSRKGFPRDSPKADKETLYNVGVIGKSGNGKSSFINAYLGLPPKEDYAAPTDVVECTATDHPYYLPDSNVVLWDVPGYDTQKVPFGDEYLKNINFKSYDFYVHVSCTKIEDTELRLHSAIAMQGKRYFYVRTKIDRDLKNLKKAHPRTFNADHEKEAIRTKIEECFPDVPVFLVSCRDTESHDLPTLRSLMADGANFSLRSHRDIVKQKLQRTGRTSTRFLENFCVLQCNTSPRFQLRRTVGRLFNCFTPQRGLSLMMDDTSFEDITQDEIDEIRRHVDEHGLSGLPGIVQDKMRDWRNIPLSIAVVGEAAVGKSTFINSIRGLTADDEGSAAVGTGDTTQEPTMYRHPYNEKLVFWDLPGVGTPRFPQDKSYLGRVGYSKYDFFLLLSDDRFTSKDIWLAREIESLKKDYFFVRTKIDDAMDSAKNSERDFSEGKVLERIKNNCNENFKAGQLAQRAVYCIDCYDKHKWDYTKLMEDILVSLPEQKRNALVLSLSPLTKGVIKSKTMVLKSRATKMALVSGIQGAGTSLIPIPLLGGAIGVSLDVALLVAEVTFYLKQYGLDDESLKELSSRTNRTVDYYRDALKGGSAIMASRQSVKTSLMNVIKSEAAEQAVKRIPIELCRVIPFVSALVGGTANFITAYYMLYKMIDDLERDAMKVLDALIQVTSSEVD